MLVKLTSELKHSNHHSSLRRFCADNLRRVDSTITSEPLERAPVVDLDHSTFYHDARLA